MAVSSYNAFLSSGITSRLNGKSILIGLGICVSFHQNKNPGELIICAH